MYEEKCIKNLLKGKHQLILKHIIIIKCKYSKNSNFIYYISLY